MENKKKQNIPRPRKNDRLFDQRSDWQNNACLNPYDKDFYLFAEGYRRAGDILVKHVKATHSSQDYLIYPIAFLYRHYIELKIKDIIVEGNCLLKRFYDDFLKVHDLDKLWKQARSIIEEVFPTDPKEDLEIVENHILQFCDKDYNSQAFRYPVDKHGNQLLPKDYLISISNLRDCMGRLASFLDAVAMGISALIDEKRDNNDNIQ